jgi:hypothetical protein
MHSFEDLVQYCTEYSLGNLAETERAVLKALETSGATSLVKALQMIQLQKAVSVVGVFSMFDALLQDRLEVTDGFRAANDLLEKAGEAELKIRFQDLQAAINVLKHDRGRSYEALVKKSSSLPFLVKLPGENFFNEGDLAEISTLIEVDTEFVRYCANMIREVSETLRKHAPTFG